MTDVNNQFNLDAHYSTETNVKRPFTHAAEAPAALPKHNLFSDKEATKRVKQINTDIYEGAKEEKAKKDFNRALYFKIFGGITLLAAGIAGIDKIRKFFRKS